MSYLIPANINDFLIISSDMAKTKDKNVYVFMNRETKKIFITNEKDTKEKDLEIFAVFFPDGNFKVEDKNETL